jgi:hypothetical protein
MPVVPPVDALVLPSLLPVVPLLPTEPSPRAEALPSLADPLPPLAEPVPLAEPPLVVELVLPVLSPPPAPASLDVVPLDTVEPSPSSPASEPQAASKTDSAVIKRVRFTESTRWMGASGPGHAEHESCLNRKSPASTGWVARKHERRPSTSEAGLHQSVVPICAKRDSAIGSDPIHRCFRCIARLERPPEQSRG